MTSTWVWQAGLVTPDAMNTQIENRLRALEAAEAVNHPFCAVYASAAQSFTAHNTNFDTLTFNTIDSDVSGMAVPVTVGTVTTYNVTIKIPGWYQVTALANVNQQNCRFLVRLGNGSTHYAGRTGGSMVNSTTARTEMMITRSAHFAIGDTPNIQIFADGGSLTTGQSIATVSAAGGDSQCRMEVYCVQPD